MNFSRAHESNHLTYHILDGIFILNNRIIFSPSFQIGSECPRIVSGGCSSRVGAVRAGTIVARSRRLMQLAARCFFLTYTTIQKIGNRVSVLCTNFVLVYCVLFTIYNLIYYINSKKRLICVKNRTSAAVIF